MLKYYAENEDEQYQVAIYHIFTGQYQKKHAQDEWQNQSKI